MVKFAVYNSKRDNYSLHSWEGNFINIYPNCKNNMIWIIIKDCCDSVGVDSTGIKLIASGKSLICIPRSAFVAQSTSYGRAIIDSAEKYHIVYVSGLRIMPDYYPIIPFTSICN